MLNTELEDEAAVRVSVVDAALREVGYRRSVRPV
jgi:hypothetical protein